MSIATLKNEAELNDSGSVFVICGRFLKGTDGKKIEQILSGKRAPCPTATSSSASEL